MFLMESFNHFFHDFFPELSLHFNPDLIILPLIAALYQISEASVFFSYALFIQKFIPLRSQRVKYFLHLRQVLLLGQHDIGTADIEFRIGHQKAEGTERSRGRRQEHGGDSHIPGHLTRVERSGASERHQGKFTGIVSSLHGYDADCPRHIGIYDGNDSGGGLF